MTADSPGALHHNQGHGTCAEQFLPGSTRHVSQHLRARGVPWPVLPKSLFPDSDTLYPLGIQGEASWNLMEGGQQLSPTKNPVVGISSFPEGRLLLATSFLSCPALPSQSRLVTSLAPASTGQVALGTGASHSWVTITPEKSDSGALVSTGFQGKERSIGPVVGL